MSAFTRANPLGWSVGSPVTSAQMNALDLDHVKTINIVDGLATYNPVGLIQIGGAGFRWNGPSLFHSTSTTTFSGSSTIAMQGVMTVSSTGKIVVTGTGDITVQSSGEVAVESGGEINLNSGSAMTWADGSLIQAEDGSTFQLADGSVANFGGIVNFGVTSEIFGAPRLASSATFTAQSGSTVTAAAGSTVTLNGTTTFANSTNPQLSPARTWTRHSLREGGSNHVRDATTGVITDSNSWIAFPGSAKGSALYTRSREGARTLIELDDLPHGQTITQVVLRTNFELDPNGIETEATYKVIRWNDEDDFEDMSASVTDSHTDVNWASVLAQTITINAHSTIDRAYRYAVEIQHHDSTDSRRMITYSCVASGTASSLVV